MSLSWRTGWWKRSSEFLMCHGWMLLYLQVNPIVALRLQQCLPKEICPGLAQSRASRSMQRRQGEMLNKEALSGSHLPATAGWTDPGSTRHRARVCPADTGTFSSHLPIPLLTLVYSGQVIIYWLPFLVIHSPSLFLWVWAGKKSWLGHFVIPIFNAD